MKGINYGHHWTSVNGQSNTFRIQTARAELRELLTAGFTCVRIAYPPFDASAATIAMCKQMVELALSLGFDHIIWGVVGKRPIVTSASLQAHVTYAKNELAPWAQLLNTSRFQLSIGNEEELHIDTSSLTVQQVQTEIHQLLSDVKEIYTHSLVDYTTAATFKDDWIALGLPSGAILGMNVYYELPAYASFFATLNYLEAHFSGSYYVAEVGTSAGFSDTQAYGSADAEALWAEALSQRVQLLRKYDIDYYVFCYKDGGFGVTADTWALKQSSGRYRDAWYAISGQRRISSRTYSREG